MRSGAGTTHQRFEYKYLISEIQYQQIRHDIEPYVVMDSHGSSQGYYPVTSLYLDSPNLETFGSSEMGEKNRFKLRLRNYSADPEEPVFFEIKRRMDQVILKKRAAIKRSSVNDLLNGATPQLEMLANSRRKSLSKVYAFRELMEGLHASPKVMVRYRREAFAGRMGNPVRITFDRRLCCRPCFKYTEHSWNHDPNWLEVNSFEVVMEVKFTDTFPIWLEQFIVRHSLLRDSLAKYCECVKELSRHGIRVAG